MANATDIAAVVDLIEETREEHGWGDVEIARRLDLGQSVLRVAAVYWNKRANATLYLVNTSESGSSRGNDAVYARMKARADELTRLADEEAAVVPGASPEGTLGSIEINRV